MTRRRLTGASATLVLASALSLLVPPTATAEDYPSWDDVRATQGDEQATQEQVARIGSALTAAQSQSASASRLALDTADAAASARAEAATAAARARALTGQAAEARAALVAARQSTAEVVASRYRLESSTPVGLRLVTTGTPEELLTRLGALDRLDETWATIARKAQATAAVASSLTAQAADAERERSRLAADAEAKAAGARDAAAAEARAVTALQGRVDTLYAQLATLKNTTADVERRFRIGQEIAEQERQRQEAERQEARNGDSGGGSGSAGEPGGSSGGSGGSSGGSGGGSAPDPDPGQGVIVDPAGAQDYARGRLSAYGWSADQFSCLLSLWNRESGWRANAMNPSSGAYGIPQALPGEKMAAAGPDWRTNGRTQVDWGLGYIADRYGSPCGAWAHSERTGWY